MRDHAHTLSDFRVPALLIECEPCGRRIVGVEELTGLSDQEAVARANKLASKRRGRIDGSEVWDGKRLVVSQPVPPRTSHQATIRASRPKVRKHGDDLLAADAGRLPQGAVLQHI